MSQLQSGAGRAAAMGKSSGRPILLPRQTKEQLTKDRPRIQQLYRAGLPAATWKLITAFSNRPNQRAPTESLLSPNLDDRIAAANTSLDKALGRKLHAPRDQTTFVMERRGQHVPSRILARELKNRFWHRLFKGSRDAAAAQSEKGKKKSEDDAAEGEAK